MHAFGEKFTCARPDFFVFVRAERAEAFGIDRCCAASGERAGIISGLVLLFGIAVETATALAAAIVQRMAGMRDCCAKAHARAFIVAEAVVSLAGIQAHAGMELER